MHTPGGTCMSEEEKKNELLEICEAGDRERLQTYFSEHEPIDIAQETEEWDSEDLQKLTSLMEEDDLAYLMEQAEDKQRIRLARTLDNKRLLVAFGYMQKDDIVDMLSDFPIGRRKDVLNLMKAGDRKIITDLLNYPDDSAGGIMTTQYIALREDLTLSDALKKIREIGARSEVIETIYVTNSAGQLTGSADLRDLLSEPEDHYLRDIEDTHVITVRPEEDQEEAAHLVSKYDLKSIPVVSNTNRILGIITVDDIIDVIQEEANEDMLQMAGVSGEESLDTSLAESIRLRLPWLLVNLATAFLASFTVKAFESTIAQVVALSATMTIVTGMGGNAGSQTMSILVRDLANGDISWDKAKKPLFKEILLGLVDGAACGLVTGIIVWLVYGNAWLGVIIFIAMIGNLVVSGTFGFLVPVVLKKLHADPAISSSIFVTTATDVLGFFIFLGLAKAFLSKLI